MQVREEFYLDNELFAWESLASKHYGWSQGSSNAARCSPACRGDKYNRGRSWIAKKYFQIPQEMRFQNSVSWGTWFTIRNSHDCFKFISVTSCHFPSILNSNYLVLSRSRSTFSRFRCKRFSICMQTVFNANESLRLSRQAVRVYIYIICIYYSLALNLLNQI